jgi:hypothetical protein
MSFGSGPIRRRREERHRGFDRLEPACRVRHIERVVIDGHGLADATALVVEPINAGHCANAGNAGGHREDCPLHGKPKSGDTQFDDLERPDLLHAGRSGCRHSRTALNLSLQAGQKRLRMWTAVRGMANCGGSRYAALTGQAEEPLRMNESIHGERTASELQDRVTELIEQQTAISEVMHAFASSPHDLQPIFDAILDNATPLCRADVCSLRLSEESGLRRVAIRGAPLLVSRALSFPALAEMGSHLSRIATSRLPSHIPDFASVEGDLRDDTWKAVVNAGFRTSLFVPLLKDDEIVGIVTLGRKEVRPFTDRQISLFRSLRKSPLPWRSPVVRGKTARCRASWRMPTASLPWANSPPRLLMKSSSPLRRCVTTPVRL